VRSRNRLRLGPGAEQPQVLPALCLPIRSSIRWTCTWSALLPVLLPFSCSQQLTALAPCSVKTKLQVQVKPTEATKGQSDEPHYTSTWDAVSKIASAEGVAGLYAGMAGSLAGVASTNFAYFYWYSVVRTVYFRYNKSTAQPSTVTELSLGAVAGALAQLFTIPVAVITTRQQTQKAADRKGFFETAQEVVNSEDGVSGLWRGLKASLVLVVNPAITYGAYERLKDIIFPGKANLKPWEAFSKRSH
jgi:hypothetical protein